MSAVNASPASFLGGTWVEWGQGRVPVGCGAPSSNSSNIHGSGIPDDLGSVANVTGGTSMQGLTLANLAAHSHSGPSHTHNMAHGHDAWQASHRHPLRSSGSSDSTPRGIGNGSTRQMVGGSSSSNNWFFGMHGGGGDAVGTVTPAVTVANTATTVTQAGGTGATGNSGSGTAHNNMMPYVTCFMWRRLD